MNRPTLETLVRNLLPLRGRLLAGAGMVSPLEVLLRLQGKEGGCSRLLLSLRPDRPGLFPVPEGIGLPRSDAPSPFREAAEGRLRGGALEGVTLPVPGERVVAFSFSAPWPRRGPGGQLLLEVMGRSGNLYLLDPEGRILAALRPLPPGNRRSLAPGALWTPPLPRGGAPPPQDRFQGHPYPTLEEAVWNWRESASRPPSPPPDPLSALREELSRRAAKAERELAHLGEEESRCQDAPRLRMMAEALLASPGAVLRGEASASLPHPAHPAEPLDIPLDPSLSAGENADRLFAEAKRMERGAALLARRREKALAEKARLSAAAEALEKGDAAPAEKATGALGRQGRRTGGAPSPARPAWKGPGKRYQREGFTILVGKGAEDNERVTFEAAGPGDLWLHARDWSGSHVVVLCGGKPVPEPVLRYAAGLAAERSGGKGSGSVEVTVTERRWVRKVKGGKPGLVQVEKSRSVRVRKDRDGEWG